MANKLPWLEEVKRDAEYNYHKRLREQEADKAYEDSKTAETSETEVDAKPKAQKKGKE